LHFARRDPACNAPDWPQNDLHWHLAVITGVKVHQRIAVKIRQPEEDA
jgi:hypothetical protein